MKRTSATTNTPANTHLRNNNNSLATYNNPTFRIKIQYPPSWEKVEEKSHGDRRNITKALLLTKKLLNSDLH